MSALVPTHIRLHNHTHRQVPEQLLLNDLKSSELSSSFLLELSGEMIELKNKYGSLPICVLYPLHFSYSNVLFSFTVVRKHFIVTQKVWTFLCLGVNNFASEGWIERFVQKS